MFGYNNRLFGYRKRKIAVPEIHIIGTRNFYVANDGDDEADGSISTPWATLAKVNSTSFVPGDVIHFKCGDTWRGQLLPGYEGSAEGHVIYSSYGKGSKPLILGSVSKSSTGDWTKVSGNIWRASGLTADVGNIILNHGAACGVKKYTSGALANQNDFWYDAANDQVRMYSVGNPASLYSSIELALVQNIVDLPLNEYTPKSHIMVHNLALKYGGAHGVWGAWSNDIILKDLDISWIGGGYLYDDVRYGNGIEFYDGLDGPVTIENCTIQQVFDAAVTFQSDSEWGDFKNVTIKDNIIRNVSWSFEYWNHESGTTENILFQGNRCYGAGINWAASQKADPSGMHVNIQWNATNSSNIKILDNIFDRATDLHVYVAEDTPNLAAFELANNTYRQPAAEVPAWELFNYDGTGYDFADYKTASGKDADSTYEEY